MSSDDAFQATVNFVFPLSIREIERRYGTKISISKIHQYGVGNYYLSYRRWHISVYVIADVCSDCGEVRAPIGNVPEHERCSRHRWAATQSEALLLFSVDDDTFEAAMQRAGEEAEKFLKDPKNWDWEIELFLSRQEFLQYRGYEHEIEGLQAENKKLLSQVQELESKIKASSTDKA